MKTEIEAKWLNIDKNSLRDVLHSLGATLVTKERLMKRKVYDYPDLKLNNKSAWVRIRDEGDKATMSFKQQVNDSLHGVKEVDLVVDNFDNACDFLEKVGLKQKAYQETKRESWLLDGCQVEIDTWPWINTFLELEAPSEDTLYQVALKLGLDKDEAVFGAVEPAYSAEFDISYKDIDGTDLITFDIDPPETWARK